MEKTTSIPKVDSWVNDKEGYHYAMPDNKIVIIPFDKILDHDITGVDVEQLNRFFIPKDSYSNRLHEITHYINYFIEFFDPEKELLLTYLHMKFLIDNKKRNVKKPAFIKMIYNILFTDSIKEKIEKMVDYNYISPIKEQSKGNYSKNLEFTDEHVRILMCISVSMKLMTPIMFHYINNNKLDRHDLYDFFEDLLDAYSDEVNIYNKLRETVNNAVKRSYGQDKGLWVQREIYGSDTSTYGKELLMRVITDIVPRYQFTQNLIAYNSVVIRDQIKYWMNTKYMLTPSEMSTEKGVDGLSGVDKMEMSIDKEDETTNILGEVNVKGTIKRIRKSLNIELSKEELEYYNRNHTIHKFQIQLVHYFYAKHFGGYQDLKRLKQSHYIKLMVMLKRRLQIQGFVYLPQIISGNVVKINKRKRNNRKFIDKIEQSSVYKQLVSEKFSTLDELGKSDLIMTILSTILNSEFTTIDYDFPEKLGEVIEITNEDVMSDEFLRFLNQI